MQTERWFNDYVFTVNDFLSVDECKRYIKISEDFGFEDSLVTLGVRGADGSVSLQRARMDYRNNQRVVFKNQEIADFLWERVADFIPANEDRNAVGCNEMLRFYRYDAGQQFDWHQDSPYERDNGEISLWTLVIYLNEDFEGGETSFEDSYSDESFDAFSVSPKTGTALFFDHDVHHKGEPVLDGRKYVLRTDVMFSSVDGEEDAEGEAWDDETWDDDSPWDDDE